MATRFPQELSWIQMENGHRVNWCGPDEHHVECRAGPALHAPLIPTRRRILPSMASAPSPSRSPSRDRSRTPVRRHVGQAPRLVPSLAEPDWSGIVGTIQHWGCFALTSHGQVMLRTGSRCRSSNDLETQPLSRQVAQPEILRGQRVAGYSIRL